MLLGRAVAKSAGTFSATATVGCVVQELTISENFTGPQTLRRRFSEKSCALHTHS